MKNKQGAAGKKRAKTPPRRTTGIFSDIHAFFFNTPPQRTRIRFKNQDERDHFSRRIMQRLDVKPDQFNVLNIHQIGIEAPVRYVFEELLSWGGDSTCWPNHLAQVERQDGLLEHINIYLLGRKNYPLGFKKSLLGLKFIPLFRLDAMKFQHVPEAGESDNARYLLYECHGGYPIGFFSIYCRSSIAEQGETHQSQLFMLVGFNFFGRQDVSEKHIIYRIWARIHNRVTANIMNRFKQLCEWRFFKIQNNMVRLPLE